MAASSNPGVVSRVRAWVIANFASSSWYLAPLLAAYLPRRLFLTYFNLFLRRRARRLLNVVDPYISAIIAECPIVERYCTLQPVAFTDTTYEEAKAYLSVTCSKEDARELRVEGARHGDGLVVSTREGEDVTDDFRGATLWWSSVVTREPLGQQSRRATPTTAATKTGGAMGSRSTGATTALSSTSTCPTSAGEAARSSSPTAAAGSTPITGTSST
jgi:hypothetical protein